MSDPFMAAADSFVANQSSSPEINTKETAPSVEQSASAESRPAAEQSAKDSVSQAIQELDKMDKFKLDGQEWTLKDLKAAIMRQQDYTKKTQELAKERENLTSEKKFRDNLYYDLKSLEKNPTLISEFLRVYPKAYHHHAEELLKATQMGQGETQQKSPSVEPKQDFQILSRLNTLEKFYHDQEVARNEAAIKQTMDDLTKKYPETDKKLARETILARAHELSLNRETPLAPDEWESIFKDVAEEVKALSKAEYGEMVKKQTEANSKARDVASGGAAIGRAPQKFKNFDEITKQALESLKN